MNAAKLAMTCRCGHAGRFHNTGTIFVGYNDDCLMSHHNGPEAHPDYRGGRCLNFEPVETWQETFAQALRDKGWVVERVRRDERGRFTRTVPA